jgi:hypothetical protein
VIAVPYALQMLYWYQMTGSAIIYTYGAKDERFEFGKMVPGMVLFSVRNGWLVYSPVMAPALVALLVHAWRGSSPARPILVIVVFTWLMYSAWWCWWLGCGFGHRGMIDDYALLVIPLAWVFRSVLSRSWGLRLFTGILLYGAIRLNFGLTQSFDWTWSSLEWSWQRLFQHVSAVITG